MRHIFNNYSSNRNIILLAILVMFFNIGLTLYFSDINNKLLDIKFFYSASEAYEIISSYGPEGRSTYIKGLLLLDYLYPIAYSLLFSFIIYRLSNKYLISLVPFLILIFDYIENSGIIYLLLTYPKENTLIATIAGFSTAIKWIFVIISILIIIYFAQKKLFKKSKNE